ncbi:MAG: 8-amino-7-oxononanoate synthase [Dokdonella sp.]|uniref:8-amino-7-oxononanoate synthase n=1 Tax=Dokdonella sp. TaxID=2291710 RepID=UPI0025BC1994|nr:8-amino-7-oxononanoate synthase [Dokdonella sp.]MBX3702054.1 8-amino-7-oxononanoate synthase [Dokdonella sp.]
MIRADLLERLAARQRERAAAQLLRRLHVLDVDVATGGAWVVDDGHRLLDFASNDYLGLARHPALIEALGRAARVVGVGAGAAHLLGGHRDEHARLEHGLAQWLGRERVLLFSTGYMANLGVLAGLLARGDLCVQDRLNHASLIDGAQLAGCTLRRYRHADVEGAARQLDAQPQAAALLASDGVFSMDGDIAPLRELAALCRAQAALCMIDDAHGLGVLGADGGGSLAWAGLGQREVPVLMGTLGKALGTFGAFVAGSAELIDGLVQQARSFIYTTALPPALAAATCVAIDLARGDAERRSTLAARIEQFRAGARARGLAVLASPTAIQPLRVGSSEAALGAAARLREAGFHVPAVRPPTVPRDQARLRVTLSALHTQAQVEQLLDTLRKVLA